jgi:peptidoglycan/LPS O-acetylase OafA/YrhL
MNKNDAVQALRGITFLAVFLYHAGLVPNGGGWGVSVFFCMSGFLLMYRNMEKDVYVSVEESVRYSLIKIKKMYPLHICMMAMALPWLFLRYRGQEKAAFHIVSRVFVNTFLVQSWFPWESIRYSLNNLSWFLSCMAFMYFMFPLIHRWIKQKESAGSIGVAAAAVCAWMFIYAYVIYCVFGSNNTEFAKGLTYNFPVYRLGDFTIGCLFGALYKKVCVHPSYRVMTVTEGIGMSFFLIVISVDWSRVIYGEASQYWWWREAVFVIPAVFIVWLFVRVGGGITQRLSQTIFVEIGNISAEAYLIHEVLLWYIDIFMWRILCLDISEWVLLKAAIGLILTIIFVRIWRAVTAVWSKRKCRNM